MTLDQLTTPFERCRVIHYGKNGNKVVKHWFNVQHIAGALYKTEDRNNEYGELEFDLILLYDGMTDGLRYSHGNVYRDWMTTDMLTDAMSRIGYNTLENFTSSMDNCVAKGAFIGNAEIEFIRQIDPQRAETYAEYRAAYYAAKEEQHRKEQLAALETMKYPVY